jgi:hypothetical protein
MEFHIIVYYEVLLKLINTFQFWLKLDRNTGPSKKNARIIKTYHSKTVKHIEMIQVLKCGERT